MTQLEKVLYTAKAHTTGGRDGASRTDDGSLDVKLTPARLGGTGSRHQPRAAVRGRLLGLLHRRDEGRRRQDEGHAAGRPVDRRRSRPRPDPARLTASPVALNVSLPGMDREAAQKLVDAAHKVCPYSNATRGNIDVAIKLV